MGFFKSLLDEAGKKTGSAIGNKLFKHSTDYVRLGDLDGDSFQDRIDAEREAAKERIELESQAAQLRELLRIQFDPHNIEYNIIALTQISAILDSLPTRLSRSEMEQKIFKMASSKIKTGIEICKSIDPDNRVVKHFESKY